ELEKWILELENSISWPDNSILGPRNRVLVARKLRARVAPLPRPGARSRFLSAPSHGDAVADRQQAPVDAFVVAKAAVEPVDRLGRFAVGGGARVEHATVAQRVVDHEHAARPQEAQQALDVVLRALLVGVVEGQVVVAALA